MKVKDLICDDIECLTGDIGLNNDISYCYTCDLLSWVMARGKEETAWITVQNNMNVVAVATMMDFSCIIVSENVSIAQNILDKAKEEEIPILGSKLTAFELCIKLHDLGIKA